MTEFSANLSMLYPHVPFLDRFGAAREDGFDSVECWFPREAGLQEVDRAMRASSQRMIVINSAPGDAAAGDWGLACLPHRAADFERSVKEALEAASLLQARFVHVMAGIAPKDMAWAEAFDHYRKSIAKALRWLDIPDVALLLEPLNNRDRPGYVLSTCSQAAEIIAECNDPRIGLMFDAYHVQISEGDAIGRLGSHLPLIRHVQLASVPGRHEPDCGELDCGRFLTELDLLKYEGAVGLEYHPIGDTTAGLSWMSALAPRHDARPA